MATTTITVESFHAALAEQADAIKTESWSTAWRWLAVAEAINAGLETSISEAGASLSRRDSLRGAREALIAAQGQIRRTGARGRLITTRTGFNR